MHSTPGWRSRLAVFVVRRVPVATEKAGLSLRDAHMNENINEVGEIRRPLDEIVTHLASASKVDTRKAITKLERIAAALASTLALTIRTRW